MLVHLITLHGHSPPRASNLRSLELSLEFISTVQVSQHALKLTQSIATLATPSD